MSVVEITPLNTYERIRDHTFKKMRVVEITLLKNMSIVEITL